MIIPATGYLKLDGGNTVSPNDRVVVKLYDNFGFYDQGIHLEDFGWHADRQELARRSRFSVRRGDWTHGVERQARRRGLPGPTIIRGHGDRHSGARGLSKTDVYKLTLDIEVVKDVDPSREHYQRHISGSGDRLGYSVSMNTDGTRMAVGAPRSNTYVSLREDTCACISTTRRKSPVWQQMGADDIIGRRMTRTGDDGVHVG